MQYKRKKKILFGIFFSVVVFSCLVCDPDPILWGTLLPSPAPCAICGTGMVYHAPCLVDVSTGEMGELRIYDYDMPGQVAREQAAGFTGLSVCAGCLVIRDPQAQTCRAALPYKEGEVDASRFCKRCRKILEEVSTGYVLLDLLDPESIRAYPVFPGASYSIRDYAVVIADSVSCLTVQISSHLFPRLSGPASRG